MAQAISLSNLQTAFTQNNTKMKEWVLEQVSVLDSFITMQWVETLPTENISTSTIYMLKNSESTEENNIYDEYVYNESTSQWEVLGQLNTGSVELTNYYTKTEVDDLLSGVTATVDNYTDEEVIAAIDGIWSE